MGKALRKDAVSHVILIVFVVLSLFPLYYMLTTSFKSNGQFYANYMGVSFPFHWENYVVAWQAIAPYIKNSFIIAGSSVIIIVLTGAMAGYSIARLRFRGKQAIYLGIVALLMIPSTLTLIPLFLEIKSFGLLNTYWGLILAYAAGGQAFTIFVFRQMFAGLPEELFEAARLDGCSELRAYSKIAVPLSKSIFGTMAIWNLLGIWNDYMLPLVTLSSQSKYPITVGIVQFQSEFITQTLYGPMFAGYVIASIPLLLLFLLTMRMFMEGLASGGLKF